MIPNIMRGKSFVGAGRYYLHDKALKEDKEAGREHLTSDERVAWTDTRNCANFDPELALVEMWKTAENQAVLKMASGQSMGGQRVKEPVLTVSLSWHPTEQPTPEQMVEAADKYLAHMGWSEHQAVYIGHDDTAHPHMHIVINRVHPETGLVMDNDNDYKRSRTWALEYERENGRIWCEKRLETENAREPGQQPARAANTNLPHNVIALTREAERQFQAAELGMEDLDKAERALLKAEQRAEREAWFDEGRKLVKEMRHAVYDAVREEYRETWKEFYADRAAAEAEAEKASSSAIGRAIHFARAGAFGEAWASLGDGRAVLDAVHKEFDARKADITAAQREEVREKQAQVIDALMAERRQGYKELLERQQQTRDEMKALHAAGERATDLVGDIRVPAGANENVQVAVDRPQYKEAAAQLDRAGVPHEPAFPVTPAITIEPAPPVHIPVPVDRSVELVDQEAAREAQMAGRGITGAADLGAGMIGGVASYLADQLAETFAPTPPEQRAAQAKALAEARDKADADKPANPYARHIGEADQKARTEREEDERDRHWDDERERRRER